MNIKYNKTENVLKSNKSSELRTKVNNIVSLAFKN